MSKINCRKILSFFLSVLFLIPSFYFHFPSQTQAWTENDAPVFAWKKPVSTSDKVFAYFTIVFDMVTDAADNLYIVNYLGYEIQKYNSQGTLLAIVGSYGTEDGQFKYPYGVALDRDGNIYGVDSGNNRIQKFDSNGNFLTKWGVYGTGDGQFKQPAQLAFDSQGNFYVTDNNNHRIQKFDANGNFITKWGSSGTGDGQFRYPRGITVTPDDIIYVVDGQNNRIQKFDVNGTFLEKWGVYGSGDGQLNSPNDLVVDSDNNVFVADWKNNRVQEFDASGNFIAKWNSYGEGGQQFSNTIGITLDSHHNLYVGEMDYIYKFDTTMNPVFIMCSSGTGDGEFKYPSDGAFDDDDNFYVTEYSNNRVQKFDASGNFVTKWGSSGSGDGQFNYPCGITVDALNNVYVAECDNYRIQKFDSDGNFITKWGSQGSGDGQFNFYGNNTYTGMDFDSQGYLYITDMANRRIQKFDANGNFIAKWGTAGTGDGQFGTEEGYGGPTGLTIDSQDYIYVVDRPNDRVQKFDTAGTFITKWGTSGTGDGQFDYPQSVTTKDGFVYVSDTSSSHSVIQKFDTIGNFLTKWGSYGTFDGQFKSPKIDINSENEILVVEGSNHRISFFKFDRISPEITVSPDNPTKINSGTAIVSGTVMDELTAITSVEYQLDGYNGPWQVCAADDGVWDSLSEGYTCSLNGLTEGTHTIYIRGIDSRTNTNTDLNYGTLTLTVDLTGPTGTISINSDEEITNTDEVTLTLTATDNLTEVKKMMVSNKGDYSGGTWETYNTSKEWRLSMGDGEKRVYVKYRDEVGNISSSYSDSIEMDMGAPTGTLVINEGEEYTSSREVVLHITGEDEVTGVEEMRISEDRTMEGVEWEGYETSREYTLSEGDGYKVIYIQYRDGIGNESEVYGSNITLDSQTEIDITEIGEEEVEGQITEWETEETTPTFTGEGEVGATIIIEIEGIETGTVVVDEDGKWSWTPSIELTRGAKYNITITSTDLAGNEDTQTFTLGISDEEVIEVNQTTPEAQITTTQLPNTGVILIIGLMFVGGLIWTGVNFKVIQKLRKNN